MTLSEGVLGHASIATEWIDRVASIRVRRPQTANAFDRDLATAFGDAVHAAVQRGVRAIVISGEGRGFSAGLDLRAFAAGDLGAHETRPEWGFAGFTRQSVPVPVIAAVQGFAIGGGAEIALAADLVVAEADAVFSFPETGHGLIAGAGGPLRLAQMLPPQLATELLLTGRGLSGAEAHAHGLVNIVAPPGGALEVALELAAKIAERSPVATRATLRLVRAAVSDTHGENRWWAMNTAELARVATSADAAEGAAAFADRRAPRWPARGEGSAV